MTTSTNLAAPSYNQYGQFMPSNATNYYSTTTAVTTINGAPITTISAQITFNEVANSSNGQASFFNMINAKLEDGTPVYIGIHEPGASFGSSTNPGGTADMAIFSYPSSTVLNPQNGSGTYSFVDGGLPSERLYNGNLNVAAGATYTVTMSIQNGSLYGSITDSTGKTLSLGYISGINATAFENITNPGHENTSTVAGSQQASDDVIISNVEYNGIAVSDYILPGTVTNNANPASDYLVQGQPLTEQNGNAIGNPVGSQVTREIGGDYMETASGSGINEVTLAGDSGMVVIGGNASSELKLTSQYHNIVQDSVVSVPILDLNGQVGTMTAAEYSQFTTFNGTGGVTIVDSAAKVSGIISSLDALSNSGKSVSITLTDSGIPTVTLPADLVAGVHITATSGDYSLAITAPSASASITGSGAALGNTLDFASASSQYTITPNASHTGFTISGNGVTDAVSNVQAVQFSDTTIIVAQTPGTSDAPTTGNITELYAAVFGRLPDVPGLAYYQNQLVANPGTPLTQFAQQFLASPEYQNNSAHGYAQTTEGDTQFITDLYNNLLHRAPAAGDAAWYEANVVSPLVQGASPGTAAYTAALAVAHAAVITDFSQSAEFLNDVQITTTAPASSQHWLLLI